MFRTHRAGSSNPNSIRPAFTYDLIAVTGRSPFVYQLSLSMMFQ